MTVLASLAKAYDRLAEQGSVPTFGYSNEKVGFVISLNPDGSIAGLPRDIRDKTGKKAIPSVLVLPQPVKRTSGVKPNFLWDKSAYVLGMSSEEKDSSEEHQAFVDFHKTVLKDTNDKGLKALLLFLDKWKSENFQKIDWPEEIKKDIRDQNIVFALESERLQKIYLHNCPEAIKLWSELSDEEGGQQAAVCLVSGKRAPVTRLHPSIKGVWGGQSSGASIVSFNLDAFSSYAREQGDNAPISKAAAFAYTTALNKFLEKGSVNRIQLGDASTIFWADASKARNAQEAESIVAYLFDIDESAESKDKLLPILDAIRQGKRLSTVAPELDEGVNFYVLGLAPNAARISIRFWFENTFGTLIKNYQCFLSDMRIEPKDKDETISLWKYLRETAVLGKSENVPPNLAGEWMRSILMGTSYPLTLLSSILMRIRADHNLSARRISILKAVLIRNFKSKEAPVALDQENRNKGYLLGRLFSVYERIQTSALGDNINATIKDKFYSSASAQPRKVFALLDRSSCNHLSKLGKKRAGQKIFFEKLLGSILDLMSPDKDPYPTAFSAEEQALFALGYYHQRSEFFKSKTTERENIQ